MSLRRALSRSIGAALATILITPWTTVPAAAAPPYTLQERAVAIASPSLVYLETIYSGYLRDATTDAPLSPSPVVHHRICSGFVVDPSGVAVSARWCVDPPEDHIRRGALQTLAFSLVSDGKLNADQVDQYVNSHFDNSKYVGLAEGSPPQAQLLAQLRLATPGLDASPAIPTQILYVQPEDQGEVAVVKVDKDHLPAAELAAGSPSGDSAIVAGFSNSGSGAYAPQSAQVRVLATRPNEKTTYHWVDGDVGNNSIGGMAIDTSGKIVGVIGRDTNHRGSEIRNFIDLSHVTDALVRAQASAKLSPADVEYRKGLDSYFSGKYSAAIKSFDQVLKESPDNYLAFSYKQNAADRLLIEGEPFTMPVWLIVLLAVVAVGVIVIVVVLIRMAAHARRREREAEILVPVSLNPFAPVSGAPTSGGFGMPMSGPPAPTSGAAIAHPAPPGVPVPFPPVQRLPEASHEQPPAPIASEQQSPPDVPADPQSAQYPAEPARTEADTPAWPPPAFIWPEEDEDESRPQPTNPWSPGSP